MPASPALSSEPRTHLRGQGAGHADAAPLPLERVPGHL